MGTIEYDLKVVPATYVPVSEDAKANGLVMWSGKQNPPAIGTKVRINFNKLETGVVAGYFIEHDYLGLKVNLDNPPDWHRKQLPNSPWALVFGSEIDWDWRPE